jgi:uncharacterized protein (UPF0332 family)
VTPEAVALARHRLQRARETLDEGELLRAAAGHDGAVNRYYYAAFYAARALLATLGLDSPKHSGVIALFNRHFVKSQLVSTDAARVLVRSFEKRLQTDYADFARPTSEDVDRLASDVRAFIDTCARLLESQSPSPPA